METIEVNGIELEYEAVGSGDPVLLIDPVLPDAVLPLAAEPALGEGFRLVRYHKRGWVGSTDTPPPVTIADHAADAATLLDALGLDRAHAVGHSSGAAIALQLALDHPAASTHSACSSRPSSRCRAANGSCSRRGRRSRPTPAATTARRWGSS